MGSENTKEIKPIKKQKASTIVMKTSKIEGKKIYNNKLKIFGNSC